MQLLQAQSRPCAHLVACPYKTKAVEKMEDALKLPKKAFNHNKIGKSKGKGSKKKPLKDYFINSSLSANFASSNIDKKPTTYV